MTTRPTHIESHRIGYYPETDYDEFGEQALPTLFCSHCGAQRKTFIWDDELECYRTRLQDHIDEFIDTHRDCPVPVGGLLYLGERLFQRQLDALSVCDKIARAAQTFGHVDPTSGVIDVRIDLNEDEENMLHRLLDNAREDS